MREFQVPVYFTVRMDTADGARRLVSGQVDRLMGPQEPYVIGPIRVDGVERQFESQFTWGVGDPIDVDADAAERESERQAVAAAKAAAQG